MKNKKKGFTLVELLAVIAILGVLLTTFIPTFLNSISNKKSDALEKIYKLIETAGLNYAVDYNLETPAIISLEELCDVYIACPIINPKTEEELDGFLYVDGEYKYYESGNVKLTVEPNGGTISQTFEEKYQSASVITLDNPTKENSEFKGWEVVQGNSILNENKLMIGNQDTILWAKWETFPTLTVNLNGGSTNQTFKESYKSGVVLELIPPTKEGYKFNGWTVSGGIISGNIFTMGNSNVTITANFVPIVVQAIYSATDNSLTFINDVAQTKGGTYNGKAVTEVYTGFTTTEYDETAVPWYSYRASIKKVEFIDEISPTSLKNWFRGFSACTEMNLKKLNTVNTISLYHTFDGMSSLTSLDVSHFDTSKVTNMSTVFKDCSKITTLDLSKWNTDKVTGMHVMFEGMTNLTNLNISNFNTSNVTTMYQMFNGCSSLITLDLSHFNTSKVLDMYAMFLNCYNLKTLNVSSFNTSNVTVMSDMFSYCKNLTTLDLSNFNISKITSTEGMFNNTGYNVTETFSIKLGSNFNSNNVTTMRYMFSNAGYNAKTCSIDLGPSFDTSNVTTMYQMFNRACSFSTTTTINLGNKFDTSNVTTMEYMFVKVARDNANFVLDLGDKFKFKDGVTVTSFATECGAGKLIIPSTVTNIPRGAFSGMTKLKEIVFEHPSTATITFPTAGSSTGAFYTGTALSTTITTTNQNVKNYAWASDNRTATFK